MEVGFFARCDYVGVSVSKATQLGEDPCENARPTLNLSGRIFGGPCGYYGVFAGTFNQDQGTRTRTRMFNAPPWPVARSVMVVL